MAGCERQSATGKRSPRPTPDDRPNIVLISIESLRADHVSTYGYARATTPNLDALAAQATRYANARSVTSWTLTSHATMFTGLYPSAHQVIRPKDKLADEHVTVAEALQAAGYQTAACVSGPYLSKPHALQQGFDYVDESPIHHMKGASGDVTNPDMEAAVFRYLKEERAPDKPFFLFAYYWDTHSEYIPPPPYDSMFVPAGAQKPKKVLFMPAFKLGRHINQRQLDYLIAQYDGEIRCTDEYLGRVFDLLRELDLWDNTVVIVTADHGEEFYEHGHNSHKNTLYVESVHVPLIIKGPRQSTAHVDERVAHHVDLYPTILAHAGLTPTVPINGQTLLEPFETDRPTFYELETFWSFSNRATKEKWVESEDWQAVRQGRYKLVHVKPLRGRTETLPPERWELYDCVADPREMHPLGPGHEETVGELQALLTDWQAAMGILARRWQPGGPAELSEEEEMRLRGLGYLP